MDINNNESQLVIEKNLELKAILNLSLNKLNERSKVLDIEVFNNYSEHHLVSFLKSVDDKKEFLIDKCVFVSNYPDDENIIVPNPYFRVIFTDLEINGKRGVINLRRNNVQLLGNKLLRSGDDVANWELGACFNLDYLKVYERDDEKPTLLEIEEAGRLISKAGWNEKLEKRCLDFLNTTTGYVNDLDVIK